MDLGLPELTGHARQLIRIPPQLDVAVTPRVLSVLDTPAMQRLKQISQLGLVSQVYPGATHSRFEHSLGVYRLACLALGQLSTTSPELGQNVAADELKIFLLAALLHDVGHWPYCHPIEDLGLPAFPRHEALARSLICTGRLAAVLAEQWHVDPARVADFVADTRVARPRLLGNLLSGPVDIDKMDYLQRDSLHAGVPYGQNFDVNRLISSLCRDGHEGCLALTEKGKTAAEMMVFARYVMFSEVYWHHTVRSATAMLQRLVYCLQDRCSPEEWLQQTDAEFSAGLLSRAEGDTAAAGLASALFGSQRALYKRLTQYTYSDSPQIFAALARRPYRQLVQAASLLSERLSRGLSCPLAPSDILLDAPPVKLEVQFKIDIFRGESAAGGASLVPLADISPVVRALATEQFDNFVKRIRVFVAASRAAEVRAQAGRITAILLEIAEQLD